MSFIESSEADLPINFCNTQQRTENEEDKSTNHEVLHFDSDNSVKHPDYEPSISDEAQNRKEDVVLDEAQSSSQRA